MTTIEYKDLNTIDIKSKLMSDGLIIVRNAKLTLDMFENITDSLGKLLVTYKHTLNQKGTIQEVSHKEMFGSNELEWHNDLSYTRGSYYGAILYNYKNAHLSPTWFMDMTLMPDHFYEKYNDKIGEYYPPTECNECFTDRQISLLQKQKISRPFVFNHPQSNKKILYCSPGTIQGCKLDLSDIIEYSEKNCYKHQWEKDDLLLWDNLRMMHKRFKFSGERVLWRTQFRI